MTMKMTMKIFFISVMLMELNLNRVQV